MATAARKYDLYSDAFRADTYATFARMREQDPVFCQPGLDGETPIWWVTRYDDAEAVLLDDERFVRDPRLGLTPDELAEFDAGLPDSMAFINSNMLERDGDDHRRLRRLVSKAFTPRMVERLRPRIQEIADGLIDPVAFTGEMELVSSFAFPLPITVRGVAWCSTGRPRPLSRVVGRDGQSSAFGRRAGGAVRRLDGRFRTAYSAGSLRSGGVSRGKTSSARGGGRGRRGHALRGRAVEHGRTPDRRGARDDGGPIGNAVLAVLTHPEQRAAISAIRRSSARRRGADPLRRAGRAARRWAAVDVELRGQKIRRGESVIVVLGAADRDRAVRAGHELALASERETRHLGFGRGPHFCLGAPLARLEAQIALATLLGRLPGLRLAVPLEELRWRRCRFSAASLRYRSPGTTNGGAGLAHLRRAGSRRPRRSARGRAAPSSSRRRARRGTGRA